jgi:glycosyltransferase involved in cell wall biosynthesis
MNLLVFNLKTDADDDVLGFTTDWINELAKHFLKVIVITMCAGRLEVRDNVRVLSVGKEKGYSELRRGVEFYRLLGKVVRTEQLDVCFAHMMPLFAVMGWPLLRLGGVPIILWYAHKSTGPVLKVAVRLVDRVVASSMSGFRVNTSKLRIIGQGIDTIRFCPGPTSDSIRRPFTVLSVGRLSPIKRIEVLIEALAILHRERADLDVQAKIVGGPLSPTDREYVLGLRSLARNLGISDRVEFVGSKSFRDLQLCYQSADCFVNSSDTDSVDKAVLEAMSCGIPIITSNISFLEVLGSDLSSRWVIKKGSATALYERLVDLIVLSPNDRAVLGTRLREIVVTGHSLQELAVKVLGEVNSVIRHRYEQV